MRMDVHFVLPLLCLQIAFAQGNGIQDFYSFSVKDIKGKEVSLENYRGKISLVVNVASECGYTDSNYKALKRLQDILSFSGKFNVLAFPCNQFGGQEPSENDQIEEFAVSEYGVEFPLFGKIDVIGKNANPAFANLIAQSGLQPNWNFYKYLVGPNGQVLSAWDTKTNVEDVFSQIENAVKLAEDQHFIQAEENAKVLKEDL